MSRLKWAQYPSSRSGGYFSTNGEVPSLASGMGFSFDNTCSVYLSNGSDTGPRTNRLSCTDIEMIPDRRPAVIAYGFLLTAIRH